MTASGTPRPAIWPSTSRQAPTRRNSRSSIWATSAPTPSSLRPSSPHPTRRISKSSDQLPAGWKVEGSVAIDSKNAFKGTRSLRLDRPADSVNKPASAVSPTFRVAPGTWEISVACGSDLKSPDNSYNGIVRLECLSAAGQVLEGADIGELYGKQAWRLCTKRVELPKGAASAQFAIHINKASGQFSVDHLSAARIAEVARADRRISRILFATAQMGNMLYPEDKRVVNITVEATKPLNANQRELTYVLRDYWGAEYSQPAKVTLQRTGKSGSTILYTASVDLAEVALDIGKYYELHAEIPQDGAEPFHNYTSLAILPKAETKKYRPDQIPFTTRSWDNRIREYFDLSDRIGLRIAGIWGGWSADAPYKPNAPSIDNAAHLDMGVLTGTPAHAIEYRERGYEKYDEKALREGVRNWIATFGKHRPLIINLGNEPHGTGEQVKMNVRAYRALYDEIKKTAPTIFVVGTSVGPEEEYFQAGFQDACDAYDFHIYEDSRDVRKAFAKYRELFKKYGGEKPIWSTELGLNSQGMTRHVVAQEVVRKLSVFFASGGQNVSWFGIMYPDGDGKLSGSSGEAHNVFDCRYNRYCPKLDAIAYYNMVNGICIKKFIGEKEYEGGVHAFLFRDKDNRCLQVLWKDKGRADALVPLPSVGKVNVIRINGSRSELDASGGGLTLGVDEDPLLLLYEQPDGKLADALSAPAATISSLPQAIVNGETSTLTLALRGISADAVSLKTPPSWNSTRTASGNDAVSFTLTPPQSTFAREANLIVRLKDSAGRDSGEIAARIPVAGRLGLRLLPEPAAANKPAGIKLILKNNSAAKQDITWRLSLVQEIPMAEGKFANPTQPTAYFAESAEGAKAIDASASAAIVVPLANLKPLTVYRVRAVITDASGRSTTRERFMAGFIAIPKATAAIKLDGKLDEADWKRSPILPINEARQVRAINAQAAPWKGPADLSANMQYLWDEKYLYVGVAVTDDVFSNPKQDDSLWAGDSLQFLVNPARELAEKPGKYDYVVGVGRKGPQAWCVSRPMLPRPSARPRRSSSPPPGPPTAPAASPTSSPSRGRASPRSHPRPARTSASP